ncbi:MAG: hypothetical protein GX434_08475 [Peptococcaceae bacterium]|nr:hypothetical protein [Peptococcaceae bacterium]
MKKNTIKKISSILLAFVMILTLSTATFAQSPSVSDNTYLVTVGNETVTLEEGQVAAIPLITVDNSSGGIQPQQAFPGEAGTLYLWADAGRLYYNVSMNTFCTSFEGTLHVTDLTSGLSGGYTPVSGFTGDIATSNIQGHRYGASMISGVAYRFGEPIAFVVDNYYQWQN